MNRFRRYRIEQKCSGELTLRDRWEFFLAVQRGKQSAKMIRRRRAKEARARAQQVPRGISQPLW